MSQGPFQAQLTPGGNGLTGMERRAQGPLEGVKRGEQGCARALSRSPSVPSGSRGDAAGPAPEMRIAGAPGSGGGGSSSPRSAPPPRSRPAQSVAAPEPASRPWGAPCWPPRAQPGPAASGVEDWAWPEEPSLVPARTVGLRGRLGAQHVLLCCGAVTHSGVGGSASRSNPATVRRRRDAYLLG